MAILISNFSQKKGSQDRSISVRVLKSYIAFGPYPPKNDTKGGVIYSETICNENKMKNKLGYYGYQIHLRNT